MAQDQVLRSQMAQEWMAGFELRVAVKQICYQFRKQLTLGINKSNIEEVFMTLELYHMQKWKGKRFWLIFG
jgi:hypothetical protein